MLVHLATLDDPVLDQPVAAFHQHAGTDEVGAHGLTDSPQSADLILFTQCHLLQGDWRLRAIRHHPLARRFPEKTLVYNESDRPWCALPGVYVNMPRPGLIEAHQRAWGYFVDEPAPGVHPGDGHHDDDARDLLFSFIGSDTAACRRPLFALRHPDAVVEQVHGFRFWDADGEDFQARRARFTSTLARSRFVLCPRGNGSSSIRLYEVLAAGAVPVIISDDWVAPSGPSWETFSVRWPEGRVDGLTELLQAHDADWPAMSREARRAHDEFFSPGVYFHNVIERCAQLLRAGSPARFPARGIIDRHTLGVAAESVRAQARYKVTAGRRRAAELTRRARRTSLPLE